MVVFQARLVVEQVDVGRPAGHEEINDVLRLRSEVERGELAVGLQVGTRSSGRGGEEVLVQERRERDGADAGRGPAEELAAVQGEGEFLVGDHGRVSVAVGVGGDTGAGVASKCFECVSGSVLSWTSASFAPTK